MFLFYSLYYSVLRYRSNIITTFKYLKCFEINMLGNLLKNFIVDIMSNPNRNEIYELVKKEPMSITDLERRTGLAYKNVFMHVKKLKEFGMVQTEKKQKEKGRPVIVSVTGKTKNQLQEELKQNLKKAVESF